MDTIRKFMKFTSMNIILSMSFSDLEHVWGC